MIRNKMFDAQLLSTGKTVSPKLSYAVSFFNFFHFETDGQNRGK